MIQVNYSVLWQLLFMIYSLTSNACVQSKVDIK